MFSANPVPQELLLVQLDGEGIYDQVKAWIE